MLEQISKITILVVNIKCIKNTLIKLFFGNLFSKIKTKTAFEHMQYAFFFGSVFVVAFMYDLSPCRIPNLNIYEHACRSPYSDSDYHSDSFPAHKHSVIT